jgi:hypothetical protein
MNIDLRNKKFEKISLVNFSDAVVYNRHRTYALLVHMFTYNFKEIFVKNIFDQFLLLDTASGHNSVIGYDKPIQCTITKILIIIYPVSLFTAEKWQNPT